jgi:hypothetical protein
MKEFERVLDHKTKYFGFILDKGSIVGKKLV